MNKAILADRIFSVYTKLPHCLILRGKHMKDVRRRFDRERLQDISIISTNCVGGEISYLLDIGFRSPFVNISMDRKDFIQTVEHLKEYMELPIQISSVENGSCVGILKSDSLPAVTIRFPHDKDPERAAGNWERRKQRINYEKLVLITDDRGVSEEDLKRLDAVPAFRKICLTAKDHSAQYPWCHQLKTYAGEDKVGEYNAKSKDGLWVFTKFWDYVSWLNG